MRGVALAIVAALILLSPLAVTESNAKRAKPCQPWPQCRNATPIPSATAAATAIATPPAPSTTATPSPPLPPPSGCNASGKPIRGTPSGYTRAKLADFCGVQPLGQGPLPATANVVVPRPDDARDCTYNDSSGRGRYCWRATTSERGGVLDIWHHTETGACHNPSTPYTHVHNGSGGCNYVSGPKWTLGERADFVVTYVARFDDIPGRKVAVLRWCGPGVGQAGYCEDNFVEAKLDGGACKGNAFHHLESSTQQTSKHLCIDLNDWHEYRMHVKPGQFVDFILDGVTVLHATTGVTSDTSYWVFQTETYLSGQAIPEPDFQGHIEIDWLTIDLPS